MDTDYATDVLGYQVELFKLLQEKKITHEEGMKMLKEKYPNVVSSDDEDDEMTQFEANEYNKTCCQECGEVQVEDHKCDEDCGFNVADAPTPLENVDDRDAPNIYPYKECTECGERESCGNYTEDNKWFCCDCYPIPPTEEE